MPLIATTPALLILWAIIGYLLGSIPFGVVLTRIMGLGNLREIGSERIGETNVLRTGNKKAAALTLLLDGAKGAVAVLLARAIASEDAAQLAGLTAMLGHCYPVWLGFKGGKGVATYIGVILALAWPVGLAVCGTWLAVAAATRISSYAALAAAAVSTVWFVLLGAGDMLVLGAVLTLMIFWRHRSNIARLREGTEPKIGQK